MLGTQQYNLHNEHVSPALKAENYTPNKRVSHAMKPENNLPNETKSSNILHNELVQLARKQQITNRTSVFHLLGKQRINYLMNMFKFLESRN